MLAVLSANIQGLCPSRGKFKLAMLKELAIVEDVGVIALTESHLNGDINDCEVAINGFNIHRCDREHKSHGGVMMYIKNDLNAIKVLDFKISIY